MSYGHLCAVGGPLYRSWWTEVEYLVVVLIKSSSTANPEKQYLVRKWRSLRNNAGTYFCMRKVLGILRSVPWMREIVPSSAEQPEDPQFTPQYLI